LRLLRPDFVIDPVRGNVDTRLRKLHEGQYDAIVLAAAGLARLGLQNEIAEFFSPEQICPAPGQGALGIQTRGEDRAREICAQLNDELTARAVRCERAVLAALGGGCQLPIGAYAEVNGPLISVQAGVFAPDGSRHVRTQAQGADPEELGQRVAQELIARGAQSICAL
jgi:hydroxymethylbilane synthase